MVQEQPRGLGVMRELDSAWPEGIESDLHPPYPSGLISSSSLLPLLFVHFQALCADRGIIAQAPKAEAAASLMVQSSKRCPRSGVTTGSGGLGKRKIGRKILQLHHPFALLHLSSSWLPGVKEDFVAHPSQLNPTNKQCSS